eukprot:322782_1
MQELQMNEINSIKNVKSTDENQSDWTKLEIAHLLAILYCVIIALLGLAACSITNIGGRFSDLGECWGEEWWKIILIFVGTVIALLLFYSSLKYGPCGVDGRTQERKGRRQCSQCLTVVVAITDTILLILIFD